MNGPFYTGVIPRTEVLGNDDGPSRGHPDDQRDQGKNDGEGCSHSCQGLLAEEIANDDRINDVVQLLEKVTQQHWHGKVKNESGFISAGKLLHEPGWDEKAKGAEISGNGKSAIGQKVMLDRDLAVLFDVKAIRSREQLKRNIEKFPPHREYLYG